MKRLTLTVFALTATLSSFAYYGSYSSGDSGWLQFMFILMLVWAILEIILFFKIWGMTDDIRSIKKDYFSETQFTDNKQMATYLRKNLVLGNTENVKRILLQNFIDNVELAYNSMKFGSFEENEKGERKWVSYKEQNMKESIVPYVKNLVSQFEKIGEEAPVYITRMKTFGDYFKLFIEEDLNNSVRPQEG